MTFCHTIASTVLTNQAIAHTGRTRRSASTTYSYLGRHIYILLFFMALLLVSSASRAQAGWGTTLQFYGDLGVDNYNSGGAGIDFVAHYYPGSMLKVGAGSGFFLANTPVMHMDGRKKTFDSFEKWGLPLFLEGKFAMKTGEVAPFFGLTIGYSQSLSSDVSFGWMGKFSLGIDMPYRMFLQLSYKLQEMEYNVFDSPYGKARLIGTNNDYMQKIEFATGLYF